MPIKTIPIANANCMPVVKMPDAKPMSLLRSLTKIVFVSGAAMAPCPKPSASNAGIHS